MRIAAHIALILSLCTLIACEHRLPNPSPIVVATHTVRGRVESLPEPGNPSTAFSVWHEDIKGWVRGDGSTGMHSMPMEFPLAEGISLEGIAVDDKVEIVIEQTPKDPIPYRIVRLTKLPAETKLNFDHTY